MSANAGHGHPHSHLFTLRLWNERADESRVEWRAKVQCVESGETRYFRDWSTLMDLLLEMLPEQAASHQDTGKETRR